MENKNYLVEKFLGENFKIIFFGSIHGKDEKQTKGIKEIFSSFIPDIVLVEGNFENANFSSEEEAIQKGGELGFACFLAKSKNIIVKGNDPSNLDQINFLVKNYGKNFTFIYFILRDLSQTQNRELIKEFIEDFKDTTNWENFNYSYENLINNTKNTLIKEIKEIHKDYFNPNLNISDFNEATKKLSEFRDNYLTNLLKNLINSYKKIFIIKGKSHLLKQKQEIAKLIK